LLIVVYSLLSNYYTSPYEEIYTVYQTHEVQGPEDASDRVEEQKTRPIE